MSARLRGRIAELKRRLFEIDPRPDLTYRSRLMRRGGTFQERLKWDAFDRPQYAYALYHAAREAHALGVPEMTAVELGVASGAGLLALERIAAEVFRETNVEIRVVGFDGGGGMPPPEDNRDLPWLWQTGHFDIDVEGLRSRLTSAELILGDVSRTVPAFLERVGLAPIGFIAFDLDYYSSTRAAMPLLTDRSETILPRAFRYFDDVVGNDYELHSDYAGELLAIRDFNAEQPNRKLSLINGLPGKRQIPAIWTYQMYVLHAFDHPRYDEYLALGQEQLPL
jgi:hypothetical protein